MVRLSETATWAGNVKIPGFKNMVGKKPNLKTNKLTPNPQFHEEKREGVEIPSVRCIWRVLNMLCSSPSLLFIPSKGCPPGAVFSFLCRAKGSSAAHGSCFSPHDDEQKPVKSPFSCGKLHPEHKQTLRLGQCSPSSRGAAGAESGFRAAGGTWFGG